MRGPRRVRPALGAELIEELERTLDDALQRLETVPMVARAGGGAALRRFRLERFHRHAIYITVHGDRHLHYPSAG